MGDDGLTKKIVRFTDCSILRDHKIYKDDLWFCDGKIINPQELPYSYRSQQSETISLKNYTIAPGFIDLQTNGGFGIDFTQDLFAKPEKLDTYSKGVLAHGVTSFCPTVVTAKPDVYHSLLTMIRKRVGGRHGAEILGIHLEGPFINRLKKGGHTEEDILELTDGIGTLKDVYGDDLRNVKIITLAPEHGAALSVISWLTTKKDIVVSLGHCMADLSTSVKAVRNGASMITHLFNSMPPFHHRNPGLIGLLGIKHTSPFYFSIICDGVHVHPAALNVAYKTHPDGIIIVTDAVSVMGLEDGIHNIGGKRIEIKGKSAFIAGTDTVCGSVTTMNESVKYFLEAVGCSAAQALEAASLHPAQALGISKKKGTLNFGSDADFVILDRHLNIISTWIAGEQVYENPLHPLEPAQCIVTKMSDFQSEDKLTDI